MSSKSNPTLIGGFVVGAIALLVVGVMLFGGAELFAKRDAYVAYFEEETKGLRVGSSVLLNGVRIGYVSEISLLVDDSTLTTLTRVKIEVLPDTYVLVRDGVPIGEGMQSKSNHEEMVHAGGLRARLEAESFVTGQLLVNLALLPETEAVLRGINAEYPEIPTTRSNIQELLAKVKSWIEDIHDNTDIADLINSLASTAQGLSELTNSVELREAIAGINDLINDDDTQDLTEELTATITEFRGVAEQLSELLESTDSEIGVLAADFRPVIAQLGDLLVDAQQTLRAANLQLSGDTSQMYQLESTLKEVEYAAAALREFFDYLERNPEALIRGKK
jgi:paraquat-inducible protein B